MLGAQAGGFGLLEQGAPVAVGGDAGAGEGDGAAGGVGTHTRPPRRRRDEVLDAQAGLRAGVDGRGAHGVDERRRPARVGVGGGELGAAGATVVGTREPGAARFAAATAPALATAHTYACGPAALVDAVREAAAELGAESRLRVEHFVPPAPLRSADAGGGTLEFARSGVTATADGRSLLEQAEAAGLRPQHGCRMGICHTCTCRKTSGHVLDLRTGEVLGDDRPDIRICVSAPVGDVTLDL